MTVFIVVVETPLGHTEHSVSHSHRSNDLGEFIAEIQKHGGLFIHNYNVSHARAEARYITAWVPFHRVMSVRAEP